jgi:exopolyphosphatase / guanosine-5'-triphosphate,3'-diphosphate pyrophosphatase
VTARVAAIDIGTNSVLLVVAERRGDLLIPIVERETITRLGAGVDRTRELAVGACARTLACLADYRCILDQLAVARLDVVGTSAMRDARGASELVEQVGELLGVAPRVLTGLEEAELTFEGAVVGLPIDGELSVFDVGGGSTEIVVGTRERNSARAASAVSLELGSVRLFERECSSDPATERELAQLDARIAHELARVPFSARGTLVGVAGTVTTLAAMDQRLTSYDPTRMHGAKLTRASVDRLARQLGALSIAARRALPGLAPGRADVIAVGVRIVGAVMDWAGASELIASDRGVRWGLLARISGKTSC